MAQYQFRVSPPNPNGPRLTAPATPHAPGIQEYNYINQGVTYQEFVMRSAWWTGLGMTSAMVTIAPGVMILARVPLDLAMSAGATVGFGLGVMSGVIALNVYRGEFLEHFAVERSVYIDNTPEPVEVEPEEPAEARRILVQTSKQTSRLSQYEFDNAELNYLASRCHVGRPESRKRLWDAAPPELKNDRWKGFSERVYPHIREELYSLGWWGDGNRWQPAAYSWLMQNGFDVPKALEVAEISPA